MKYLIVIVYCCFSFLCFSQIAPKHPKKLEKAFEEARVAYAKADYPAALEKINMLIEKNESFLDAYLLKADILHEMKEPELEAKSLKQALKIDSLSHPKIYYLLGNTLKTVGKYSNARQAYSRFIENAGISRGMADRARQQIANCDFAIAQMERAYDFNPISLGDSVNTEMDEYWPSLSLDGKTLIFTRLVPFSDSLTGRRFYQEDFFISENRDAKWGKAMPVSSINTSENEGAQAISPDARLLFFTACSRRDTWGSCDIYFSVKTEGGWSAPKNAGQPVNSTGWDSQPSVSGNNEYLYFVSNRKGGKGGMDIWRCRLTGFEGGFPRWDKAENLGDSINTPGNEMSPFIHPDGQTLYFASDHWPGMGGNDLFFSKMKPDSTWSKPVNLGYPVNTWNDERGLIVDASGQTAFYSSDKEGSGMDLFSFELPEPIRPIPVTYLQCVVTDAKSGNPLVAEVEITSLGNTEKTIRLRTCKKGEFLTGIPLGQNYLMNVSAPGYLFYSEHFKLNDSKSAIEPFVLEIRMSPVEPGAVTVLRNIFFDTASHELQPASVAELHKLAGFLEKNPSVSIEIGGHTDTIGSEGFNIELSEKRAKSVCRFLVQSGISEERLSSRGYGFSQPVQPNDNEEGRAANRRTEFKIIK